MKQKQILALLVCVLLALTALTACGGKPGADADENPSADAQPAQADAADDTKADDRNEKETTDMEHTKVKVTMENGGTFTMELYPEYAPKTVENFIKLVESGYYAGTSFHRVYPGFMAQGGEGAETPSIKGEFASNGFTQNTLKHTRGVVSMARISSTARMQPLPAWLTGWRPWTRFAISSANTTALTVWPRRRWNRS